MIFFFLTKEMIIYCWTIFLKWYRFEKKNGFIYPKIILQLVLYNTNCIVPQNMRLSIVYALCYVDNMTKTMHTFRLLLDIEKAYMYMNIVWIWPLIPRTVSDATSKSFVRTEEIIILVQYLNDLFMIWVCIKFYCIFIFAFGTSYYMNQILHW